MIRLLNSAMMPKEGRYTLERITLEEFCKTLIEAYNSGVLDSYIGYQDNLDLIYEWTGIKLPLNRATTTVKDGDRLLIMKLRYRLGDPSAKGRNRMNAEDFEFFVCDYREGP